MIKWNADKGITENGTGKFHSDCRFQCNVYVWRLFIFLFLFGAIVKFQKSSKLCHASIIRYSIYALSWFYGCSKTLAKQKCGWIETTIWKKNGINNTNLKYFSSCVAMRTPHLSTCTWNSNQLLRAYAKQTCNITECNDNFKRKKKHSNNLKQ